ncbi:protein bem46, putative [Pediculus humanus corporis]|uniref:Protein ABHD13 n=1 Tax=Pediculus humanus subsp. corporis TaxID=121224 RepID=E0VZT2_PEDHC|nr:protein bem46, putative [Pediculus humanus corporis]EEB18888.1 protein bem46, putative [Pediculus humanus corporis]
MNTRFTLTTIGRKACHAVGRIIIHCWALAGATLLCCFLLYWVLGGLIPFLLLCFAATGILYQLEDYLLFHPDLPPYSRLFVSLPSVFGLPYESVFTRSGDGTLIHLFLILQPGETSSKAPTLLFFHGNAGNVGHRLQNMVGLYQSLHCNIVMLEYRGYGLSQGIPSEEGIYMDARAALDFISSRQDFNHKEIILFGRSLGGAVAIDLTCNLLYSQKIWCLIVENSFTSIPDMARILLGWRILRKLPLVFYKSKFLSKSKINQVKVPTLFVSGLSDSLVPSRMMKELYDECSSEHKKLVEFPNGTHNETWTCQGYYTSLDAFIKDVRLRRIQNYS